MPPYVPSVLTCEATPAPRRFTRDGETEQIEFKNPISNPGAYRLYFAVGAPTGAVDAPFTVEVDVFTGGS